MGDRYYLDLNCPYCKEKVIEEVYYAPTSNFLSHNCKNCKKEFFITADFNPIKKEDWTKQMGKDAYNMASNLGEMKAIVEGFKESYVDLEPIKRKYTKEQWNNNLPWKKDYRNQKLWGDGSNVDLPFLTFNKGDFTRILSPDEGEFQDAGKETNIC